MKKLFGLIFMVTTLGLGYWYTKVIEPFSNPSLPISDEETQKRLEVNVNTIRKFIAGNSRYNSNIVFLADLKIMSGKNRFFVYNLKLNKITDQGLMAHGSGSETGIDGELKFSNIPNSYTSSLGKYEIGHHYTGKFGKAYKLFGLDKTNDKALERFIVLHHFEKVPYEEQSDPICHSLGCPMLNETFFNRIEKIIDNSKKPILLMLYY